jgi:hypothetical protein
VNLPAPRPGLVIRYACLWDTDARAGGLLRDGEEHPIVRVLPITHAPPHDPADALEIPTPTKDRLGPDSEPSWVVLSRANDFIWPDPDLRPVPGADPGTVAHGFLPPGFLKMLRERLQRRWRETAAKAVARSR